MLVRLCSLGLVVLGICREWELVSIEGSEKERQMCTYGFGFWQANHSLPFFSFSSLLTPRSSSPCLLGTGTFFFFTCLETAKRWGGSPDVNN